MPSCDATPFVPLGGTPAGDGFRPLGRPAPDTAAPEPARPPAPDPRDVAFEAGRAQGRADAAAEHAVLARDLAATLRAVHAWREELRTRYTPTLVGLALAIARRIVGEALDARPERWAPIVAGAIHRLVDREHVTVRVSPRLAAVLRHHAGDMGGGVRVVEDAALGDDACRVEGAMGDVDCGIGAQLAAVADALGVDAP